MNDHATNRWNLGFQAQPKGFGYDDLKRFGQTFDRHRYSQHNNPGHEQGNNPRGYGYQPEPPARGKVFDEVPEEEYDPVPQKNYTTYDPLPKKDIAIHSRASSAATIAVEEDHKVETKEKAGDKSHQIISSLFIGPKAENLSYFQSNIDTILKELKQARVRYHGGKDDETFITEATQNSKAFQDSMTKLSTAVQKASNLLGRHSIPFWSPRYQAHMCTDLSMASMLGYFMTMLYNPNNVALEASPLSTVAEIEVGEQLCELFGYNIDEEDTQCPTGWGHVTCDGTIANLESIWVARNLKYYPLALKEAMGDEQPLEFVRDTLSIETCKGEWKNFYGLSEWELLNLKSNDILDIPDRLAQEFGISNTYLSKVMDKFAIQSNGKEDLEKKYLKNGAAQYMLANTRHYSWPKGAAIAGIGSENVVGIPVDNAARVDVTKLEERLRESLKAEQPVYAVVAIIGSTEEGAVDSLSSILALRKQLQAEGMSFLVHGDAAWGGYFCSMLPKQYHPGDVINLPTEMGDQDGFVPDACLRSETQDDLYALRFADSVTVDPHKAGYIPYPAGGLCYRDGRMRFLVTWTSPYLSRGSVTSIGIYGVEGSKPGASAVSTWLSNKVIGLNQEGYGTLLAEVTWTCTRLSAEWAVLSTKDTSFTCVPLNELPSELAPGSTEKDVEAEKDRIRKYIVEKTNSEIIEEDKDRTPDEKVTKLMRALGSDLNINAFALNFRHAHSKELNDDVEEANYLMQRVIEALSVDSPTDDPTKIPLYLTSTEFSDDLYGDCKRHYMDRLGLKQSTQDLMVLRNVVMSPFPSDGNFISKLAKIFKDTVERETKIVQKRNELGKDFHSFLIQGSVSPDNDAEQICLIHLPMFHVANHRQQLIVRADFDAPSRAKYRSMRLSNQAEPMILVTQQKVLLSDIVRAKTSFVGQIMTKESGIILKNITASITACVVSRPLNSQWRLKDYPSSIMPFYAYRDNDNSGKVNIDHVIVRAPNTQLSASGCTIDITSEEPPSSSSSSSDAVSAKALMKNDLPWDEHVILAVTSAPEAPRQPFPSNTDIGGHHGSIVAHLGDEGAIEPPSQGGTTRGGRERCSQFFFRPGAKLKVDVYLDGNPESDRVEYASCLPPRDGNPGDEPCLGRKLGSGTLTLGDRVYVDSEAMNHDPFAKVEKVTEWRHEFNQIGKDLD